MPAEEEAIKRAMLRAVEARVEAIRGQRGERFDPQAILIDTGMGASAAIRREAVFATGYNGTTTTLPFTADISVMDSVTLFSVDLVTM